MNRTMTPRPLVAPEAEDRPRTSSEDRIDDRWIEDMADELGCLGLSSDEIPTVHDEMGFLSTHESSKTYHREIGI